MQTPKQQLATELLGTDVTEWIRTQRRDQRTWNWIGAALGNATENKVHATRETLRKWSTTRSAS
jgi:hypothetical protein